MNNNVVNRPRSIYLPSGIVASLFSVFDESKSEFISYHDVQFLLEITQSLLHKVQEVKISKGDYVGCKPYFYSIPQLIFFRSEDENQKTANLRNIISKFVERQANFEDFGNGSYFELNEEIKQEKKKSFETYDFSEIKNISKDEIKRCFDIVDYRIDCITQDTYRDKLFNKVDKIDIGQDVAKKQLGSNFYKINEKVQKATKEEKITYLKEINDCLVKFFKGNDYNLLELSSSDFYYDFISEDFLMCFKKAVFCFNKLKLNKINEDHKEKFLELEKNSNENDIIDIID